MPVLHFGAAHVALALAFGSVAVDPRGVSGFFYHARMLGIVHLITLGWITASILGSLYIVGPIALRVWIPAAVATGESFSREGDEAEAFFVLTSGRVKLTQLTPEGHQVVLRIIGAGDAFGGAGAFGDLTYPIGAEAVEPAVALV